MNGKKLPMSKRLLMNAALVPECSVFADIGCDHAYTSIYLVESGTAKSALAMDVRSGPLMRAQENIDRRGLCGRIQTRLSDGLSKLSEGEADCILISGMGGPLIIDILKKDQKKVRTAECIVLQPQSEIAKVREFLHSMGYRITAEDMCREDGKFYTALRAQEGDEKENNRCTGSLEKTGYRRLPEQTAFRYGACLIAQKHPVLKEYVQNELAKKRQIARQLAGQSSARGRERLVETEKEMVLLCEVLRFLEE